ncbi:uncharacterized protein LOC117586592 [Drosophila guanche]|uniref:Blast:PiggyBac transposable element-derived protein 4 n=1 Tax=Drosophila guanche TaxID=7266 RepID=A0A3B0JPH1_DROGU|nr:uncharacterized protein LOC117586592 [Drosophila guanche]SPP84025.1 blast:PiggyBac transposable element-derived protein 4 [Drosophila guanche]
MSTSGRKRKQQLKPRQDDHRSPIKRSTVDIKKEPLDSSYPALADYHLSSADIKPDLTELHLEMAAAEREQPPALSGHELDNQESDSDEDGYSEINYEAADVFTQDEVDNYDPEWTTQQSSTRLLFKFNTPVQQTGLKGGKNYMGPQHYLNQILGHRGTFFFLLAKSCNRRAKGCTLTHAEEMEAFVGLSLLMSDVKLNELADYWSTNMHYGFVGFKEKMSLERYRQLMQWLNFDALDVTAKSNADDYNKLLTFINERMAELYVCGQQLVLNDPVTLWKGRFSYNQDLAPKFRSNALLLHMLTEQSGLIIKVLPEIVQREKAGAWVRNSRQLVEHRNELALKLVGVHQEGRTVYASKFYGSYGLAFELSNRNTYCTGLLDRNRYGNSKALVHQQLTSNSIVMWYATPPLMMGKWRRREKSLYFFSSDCLAIYSKEMSMQKTNARPKLIQEIDRQLRPANQIRQQLIEYQPTCQGLQSDKKMVIFLLNMIVYNSYLLYQNNTPPPRGVDATLKYKNYPEFRVAIIRSLLRLETSGTETPAAAAAAATSPNKAETTEKIKKAVVIPDIKLITAIRHDPILIRQNGKPARKNCRYCHKGGMLQYSKYMCNSCPDKPGLCQEPCFRLWHEQLKK